MEDAECRNVDTSVFFPSGGDFTVPKAICQRCDVRVKCLETSLKNNDEYGVFGGLTPNERDDLRYRRDTGLAELIWLRG